MNCFNIVLITVLLLANSTKLIAQKIPVTSFSHLPLIDQPKVSPDGKTIAAIMNGKNGASVIVSVFGSRKIKTILRLKKDVDRIDGIYWTDNDTVLVQSTYPKMVYDNIRRIGRLFSIDKSGANFREIKRRKSKNAPSWAYLLSTSEILSLLPDDPDHILLSLYDDRDKGYSPFKVNVKTNTFEKLFINENEIDVWITNEKGDVTMGIKYDKSHNSFWFRDSNNDDWKNIYQQKRFQDDTFEPIAIINEKLYVISNHQVKKQALWTFDIKTGKFDTLIYEVDGYDIDHVLLNSERTKIVGFQYLKHFWFNHYFDQKDVNHYQIVKDSFPDKQTTIFSRSKDKNRVIAYVVDDNQAPQYYWMDIEKKAGGLWFVQYPYLEKETLANVEPFELTTSDNMRINGYLTMPVKNVDDKSMKKPKLIVFPHGGPQSRDSQYFNHTVQYFASKGYAVLQVNFRGSTGFGDEYQTKGYRQWGKRMQEDIYETIEWLEKKNTVDVKQSCIVGASYGGYVALTASFQRPDLFKCIVSIAGISDLESMVDSEYKNKTLRSFIENTIGNPNDKAIRESFRDLSAINHIDKIKKPILLIHGALDTRVDVAQSLLFYEKAKEAKKDIQFKLFEYGTHFLDEQENRKKSFEVLDAFLEKHLN